MNNASAQPVRTEKHAQILAAAHQLFLANGYKRTSMESIRALAGVSKPTLYAYYTDKEALFADVVHTLFHATGIAYIPKSLDITTATELRQALITLITTVIHNIMTSGHLALLRIVISEMPHFPHLVEVFRQNGPIRAIGMASQLFHELHQHGLIQLDNAELAARMFMGPMLTYIFTDGLLQAGEPKVPDQHIIEQHVDLFLKAVRS